MAWNEENWIKRRINFFQNHDMELLYIAAVNIHTSFCLLMAYLLNTKNNDLIL